MASDLNPFDDLYVTETASPNDFVALFSSELVEHAETLFKPVNVVLKGTQGSGKTMLLSLLQPEIRADFHKANREFPVRGKLSHFIGATINLTRSAALDIGQRPLAKDPEQDEQLFPLYFADFLNYWVVRDLMWSIKAMVEMPDAFPGIIRDHTKLDEFAKDLAQQDCWFGYLNGISSFEALRARLDERISHYRAFHQYNIEALDPSIQSSKTAIGEPIARVAASLCNTGVVKAGTPIYVVVDQVEILSRSDRLRPALRSEYRKIINRALSTRDPRVFYRMGVRRHAWEDELSILGDVPLEQSRNYRLLDLDDEVLRRWENEPGIFPSFAHDVFRRRLRFVGLGVKAQRPLRQYFGSPLSVEAAAKNYAGTSAAGRVLGIEDKWPKHWKEFLLELYESSPLTAKLAGAWIRQTGGKKKTDRSRLPIPAKPWPWDHKIWRKERVRQALMQIAARCGQRMTWSGDESVMALSGSNILVFISICQNIWDAFNRAERRRPDSQRREPQRDGIDEVSQAIGIQLASKYWYDKIVEWPGGQERRKFVDRLGRLFQSRLNDDLAMSNPGHNGFSLIKEEIEGRKALKRFLDEGVNYGDLLDAPHTTKEKNRKLRTKWYLSPILSPYFRIPETHVKEPIYVDTREVRKWTGEAGVYLPDLEPIEIDQLLGERRRREIDMSVQLQLFDPLAGAKRK